MESLNFADIFVTFLALLGPQKILLSFEQASRPLDPREFRYLAQYSSAAAAAIGVLCALTAPWLTSFFHISGAAVLLPGGSIFFVYTVTVIFGVHLDTTPAEGARRGNPCPPRRQRVPRAGAPVHRYADRRDRRPGGVVERHRARVACARGGKLRGRGRA
jgi:hypothetical protein